jgi:hypothetical protein
MTWRKALEDDLGRRPWKTWWTTSEDVVEDIPDRASVPPAPWKVLEFIMLQL